MKNTYRLFDRTISEIVNINMPILNIINDMLFVGPPNIKDNLYPFLTRALAKPNS